MTAQSGLGLATELQEALDSTQLFMMALYFGQLFIMDLEIRPNPPFELYLQGQRSADSFEHQIEYFGGQVKPFQMTWWQSN